MKLIYDVLRTIDASVKVRERKIKPLQSLYWLVPGPDSSVKSRTIEALMADWCYVEIKNN